MSNNNGTHNYRAPGYYMDPSGYNHDTLFKVMFTTSFVLEENVDDGRTRNNPNNTNGQQPNIPPPPPNN